MCMCVWAFHMSWFAVFPIKNTSTWICQMARGKDELTDRRTDSYMFICHTNKMQLVLENLRPSVVCLLWKEFFTWVKNQGLSFHLLWYLNNLICKYSHFYYYLKQWMSIKIFMQFVKKYFLSSCRFFVNLLIYTIFYWIIYVFYNE